MNADDIRLLVLMAGVSCVFLGVCIVAAASVGNNSGEPREKPAKDEPESVATPTVDKSKRFPADQRLREAGFVIASRPDKGQATWRRNGREFLESVALQQIGASS